MKRTENLTDAVRARRRAVISASAAVFTLALTVGVTTNFVMAVDIVPPTESGDQTAQMGTPPEMPSGEQPTGTPPELPNGEQPNGSPSGMPGGGESAPTSWASAKEFTADATEEGQSYTSSNASENAVHASAGTVTLNQPTVDKTGDASEESADFYGINAAMLATDTAVLNINGGTVTTAGGHANGVFAYGNSTINIADTKITTTGNNSGGIMVTGGGTLNASNLTVKTSGNSSAAIRSDRGGGTETVTGGTFETNGQGSPAVYSTADVSVSDAKLTSNSSEGVVIEGMNSVSLNNVELTDTNNSLNGQSETYKNIFIYQSMSGDATVGTGTFTATQSTINTEDGGQTADSFFVTNTNAAISLSKTIVQNNAGGVFLRAQAGKWGNQGQNGGNVVLNLTEQGVIGDIVVDNISTLTMNLATGSYYRGTINGDNTANSVMLNLSEDSIVVLDGDSYVSGLANEKADNSNIYTNGHKLYVSGEEVKGNTSTDIPSFDFSNSGVNAEDTGTNTEETETESVPEDDSKQRRELITILCAVIIVLIAAIATILIRRSKKGKKTKPQGAMVLPDQPAAVHNASPDTTTSVTSDGMTTVTKTETHKIPNEETTVTTTKTTGVTPDGAKVTRTTMSSKTTASKTVTRSDGDWPFKDHGDWIQNFINENEKKN